MKPPINNADGRSENLHSQRFDAGNHHQGLRAIAAGLATFHKRFLNELERRRRLASAGASSADVVVGTPSTSGENRSRVSTTLSDAACPLVPPSSSAVAEIPDSGNAASEGICTATPPGSQQQQQQQHHHHHHHHRHPHKLSVSSGGGGPAVGGNNLSSRDENPPEVGTFLLAATPLSIISGAFCPHFLSVLPRDGADTI
ncbi:unnamed protein product [Protopolystoma xenopodis]|uniref:Uncharacterized protein n=1 Tax=Protopolystoma xenopodis TaxID=117903 RepID=A0A448WIU9_9PLAT|nr:unnamed protein product [Protopolystoma xenopodis]